MIDLDQWTMWMRAGGQSKATIRTRLYGMGTLCRHARVEQPAQLTCKQISDWLSSCHNGHTRLTYWQTARSWARWAVSHDVITTDPTADLTRPRSPKMSPRPISDETVTELIATTTHPTRTYAALAAYAGLRVHEVAKVHATDVELSSAGWLFVDGKGGKQATIPLHPVLTKIAADMPTAGWWFPGHDNGHISGAWVGECIRKALRDIGSPATAHQLRHSFGTAVLRSTHDLRVTQELLRHASPASTAIYTQVADLDKIAAVNSLGWVA
jgi:integrase/recombinase XerD